MPVTRIVPHKWQRKDGFIAIEKFWYTEKGECWENEYAIPRVGDPVHEGRILLHKQGGHFIVDWSTKNMLEVQNATLPELRLKLKDYLDGLRSKSLVADIDTWPKFIIWTWQNRYERAALILDDNDKVVRSAIWDEGKAQYVPLSQTYNYGSRFGEREPYSDARWTEIQVMADVLKAADRAVHALNSTVNLTNLRKLTPGALWMERLSKVAEVATLLTDELKALQPNDEKDA